MLRKFLISSGKDVIISLLYLWGIGLCLISLSILYFSKGVSIALMFIPFGVYLLLIGLSILKAEKVSVEDDIFPIFASILSDKRALIGYIITYVPAVISGTFLLVLFLLYDAVENILLYTIVFFLYFFGFEMINEKRLMKLKEKASEEAETNESIG